MQNTFNTLMPCHPPSGIGEGMSSQCNSGVTRGLLWSIHYTLNVVAATSYLEVFALTVILSTWKQYHQALCSIFKKFNT